MVHEKHLDSTATGDRYLQPGPDPAAAADPDLWIKNAIPYCGAEKRFADEVLSHSPGEIDIEMALPGRTALRMDIVALERAATGWRLVFWEAKLATNPEARSTEAPRVLTQRQNYLDWLGVPGQKESVVEAYRQTCALLVRLQKAAGAAPLGEGIQAVADGADLAVDHQIRLLVDARRDTRKFVENGHLKKLQDAGLHVHMVSAPGHLALRAPE